MIPEIYRSVYYGVEPGWEFPSPNADRHTKLDWVLVLRRCDLEMDLSPVRMLYATLAPESGLGLACYVAALLKVRYGWFAARLQHLGLAVM